MTQVNQKVTSEATRDWSDAAAEWPEICVNTISKSEARDKWIKKEDFDKEGKEKSEKRLLSELTIIKDAVADDNDACRANNEHRDQQEQNISK